MEEIKSDLARSAMSAFIRAYSEVMEFPNAFKYGNSLCGLIKLPALDVQINPPAIQRSAAESQRGKKINVRTDGSILSSSVGINFWRRLDFGRPSLFL